MGSRLISHINRPVLTAAIAVFNLALFIIYVWGHVTGASDGARLNPGEIVWASDGVIVTALDESPTGLATGDIVISVGGKSIESWTRAALCLNVLCEHVERPRWTKGRTVEYVVLRDGNLLNLQIQLRKYPLIEVLQSSWGGLVFACVTFLIIGGVFLLRPNEPAVRVLLIGSSGLLGSMPWAFGLQVGDIVQGTGLWLHRIAIYGVYLLTWIGFLHFALIFPRPHPVVVRRRWLIPFLYCFPFTAFGGYLLATRFSTRNVLTWQSQMSQGNSTLVLIYLIGGVAALVANYRVQRDAVTRQQIRIVIFANSLVAGLAIPVWIMPQALLDVTIVNSHIMGVIGLLIPVALTASILRYRLWDIEILINRTLVYGILTAIVIGIYVIVVGIAGAFIQTGGDLAVSLFATGIVAVSFQPLRERLQRGVNRLMFGERDDPYAILERLAERLEAVVATQSVLPIIVETVADALKLPYAAVALRENDTFAVVAEHKRVTSRQDYRDSDVEALPLIYQAETIGQLIIMRRGRAESFSRTDMQLLEMIARQAGVAAYNVRLTQDLQRSRERLVTAREEERRRLRRDLHDGLGPALASMSFKLDAVHNFSSNDPGAVRKLAHEIKSQIQNALTDIRRIAYNLRPPALDELGLVAALKEHIRSINQINGLQIDFVTAENLPPLPAAIEVAVYRIVLEAVTNVQRHANARHCTVHLQCGEKLNLEIQDDGQGIKGGARMGVGLTAMRERAAELGGDCMVETGPENGTRISVQMPILQDHLTVMEADNGIHPSHHSG